MKYLTLLSLLFIAIIHTSCIKEVFKKKKDTEEVKKPEEKYFGFWKVSNLAVDINANNTIESNEIRTFTGTSELRINTDKSFSYFLTTSSGTTNLNGNWALSTDQKSIIITDPAQGAVRFDPRSDNEIQTEPISTANGTAWIIYRKQ
jgi:hypothetical protein